MRKRRIRIIIGVILVPLMFVAALLAVCFMDNHINRYELYVRSFFWGQEPFDKVVWKRCEPDNLLSIEEQDTRGRMLFSFLRKHPLPGITREEVENLLGRPARADGGYGIGNQTGMKIDPDVLYLNYDASGRVSDFHTEQH